MGMKPCTDSLIWNCHVEHYLEDLHGEVLDMLNFGSTHIHKTKAAAVADCLHTMKPSYHVVGQNNAIVLFTERMEALKNL